MIFFKSYFFLLLLSVKCVQAKYDDWEHCTVLDGDGKFHVCWKATISTVGLSEIVFGVDVETLGYVGLGLSLKGGMRDSDIVTGWVKDGLTYFQDRHGVGDTIPPIDSKSDWELLYGSENETHTSLVFRRKLDTCDEEDFKIDGSTVRLTYAYSNEDPVSESGLQYHYGNRGAKSTNLLHSKGRTHLSFDKSELQYWDVLANNHTLTSDMTTEYWCTIHRIPFEPVKSHIVLVEPIIQGGNEDVVHHMLLYECVGALPGQYDSHIGKTGFQCLYANMAGIEERCEGVSFAWAIGGEAIVFPDNVGYPIEAETTKYFRLEIHYDNPFKKNGIIDNSGLRLYYTPNLRENDAGSLMLGASASLDVFIPPGQEEFTVAGHTNKECLEPYFPEKGIKMLSILLHSHLSGRRIKTRHFRNNVELKPLADDNNYDFNYQDYRYFDEEIEYLPGDHLTVECTYDTSDRKKATFGGQSTKEEMCMVFILYYPLINVYGSLSYPSTEALKMYLDRNLILADVKDQQFYESIMNYNWDLVDAKNLEKGLMNSEHDTYCYLGNGSINSIKSVTSYPKDLQPYQQEELSCIQNNGYISTSGLKTLYMSLIFVYAVFILRKFV